MNDKTTTGAIIVEFIMSVIDDETRFHLASVISKQRSIDDARMVLRTAKKRSHGKRPIAIVTDGLKSYEKAVDKEFHTAKQDTNRKRRNKGAET